MPHYIAAVVLWLAIGQAPVDPRPLETVFYDSVDEHGRLVGGAILLPEERPAWAVKPRGTGDNRVDIVIVGDGYQASQQALFHAHAANAMSSMFSQQPFATYAPLFRIHELEVVSVDSGVDNDPTQGILRNTALDMAFWCNGTERLLCVSVSKAWNFASAAPDVDQILALANSTKYGGAGYTSSELATCSGGNGSAPEIAIHEFGHSIGNLADEYDYGGPTNYTGPEPARPNVSILNAAAMASAGTKWAAWLGYSNAAFDGLISTFEGANYSQFGIYRPTNNSKMRALGRPFNLPGAEALIIEIYKIVRPIDGSTDTGLLLAGTETVFVTPVAPVGNPLTVQWSLDGSPIAGATAESLDLASIPLGPGGHALSVTVVDSTWMVRNEADRNQWMRETRSWQMLVPNVPGDVNCDRLVDAADATALAIALVDPSGFAAAYPGCPPGKADVNADSGTNGLDIQAWVQFLLF